ncbi:MAG: DUF86 domain-containing protein [Clostridiales bacterium]|jgi:uncharacterized protein with HEPN domain|nr:DUF86 domain-containing protein [Clostridiales bacterium]
MNERDKAHIERIADEVNFICGVTSKAAKEQFLHDDILQHALCMSLVTIGECANHLSEDFKTKYPQLNWVQIIAVRNIAAHGYWQLDMTQIWQAVEEDIPLLKAFVDKLITNQ